MEWISAAHRPCRRALLRTRSGVNYPVAVKSFPTGPVGDGDVAVAVSARRMVLRGTPEPDIQPTFAVYRRLLLADAPGESTKKGGR